MKIIGSNPAANINQKPEKSGEIKTEAFNETSDTLEKVRVPFDTLNAYKGVKQLSNAQKAVLRLSKCADDYAVPKAAFENIIENINNTQDEVVKKETQRLFGLINSALDKVEQSGESQVLDILIEINELTDAVNAAKENYCSVGCTYFCTGSKSDTKQFFDAVKSGKGGDYQSFLYALRKETNQPVSKEQDENFKDSYYVQNNGLIKDFVQQQKYDKLKEYLADPSMGTKELKDYLYEKYYISDAQIPENIKDLSRKINDEFKVKMFYSSQTDFDKEPQIVYDELVNWKKAGKDDFMPPSIIDINLADETFLGESKAYMFYPKIVLRPATGCTRLNLRHELAHLNDRYQFSLPFGERKLAMDVLSKQLFKDELAKAGISKKHQDYAYTNENELIAVAATGDSNCYCKEFKKTLVKLGLPEYVFDLPALT